MKDNCKALPQAAQKLPPDHNARSFDLTPTPLHCRWMECHQLAIDVLHEGQTLSGALVVLKREYRWVRELLQEDEKKNLWTLLWFLGSIVKFLCQSGHNDEAIAVQQITWAIEDGVRPDAKALASLTEKLKACGL